LYFSLSFCRDCLPVGKCYCSWLTTIWYIGCGRFFEGNAAEMHKALNTTLANLPNDTKVYVSVT